MDVVFNGYTCFIKKSYYSNHNIRLQMYDKEDGCPVATITAYTDKLEADEVSVKSYSENAGLYKILVKEQIVTPAHRWIRAGFENLAICNLGPNF